MDNPSILIVECDDISCQNLKTELHSQGYKSVAAINKTRLSRFFKDKKPDLIIFTVNNQKPNDGLTEIRQIRGLGKHIPVILIAKHSSEELAIAALKAGVNDYFKWPFSDSELVSSIRQNLPAHKISPPDIHIADPMIGNSESMQEIKAFLQKVAVTDSTVLITGETGTGKGLAAELIHRTSLRKKGAFVCINCAAIPENLIESEMFGYEQGAFTGAATTSQGKFEQANQGTVFLDEIADMSLHAQAKILRVLESREISRIGGKKDIPLDLRVAAATNHDPEQLINEGKFRADLYYRLNVARVHLPPLRDRKEDIPYLVNHIIGDLNQRYDRYIEGLTDDAMEKLLHYHWPGNIRELKNCLESTCISLLSRRISFMDFPDSFRKKLKFAEEAFTSERDMVLAALSSTNWNKTEAAKKLNWSRMKVYRTLKRHKIHPQMRN